MFCSFYQSAFSFSLSHFERREFNSLYLFFYSISLAGFDLILPIESYLSSLILQAVLNVLSGSHLL